jgi:glycosyltransferase involved in cell wall biosynthesis
MEQWLRSTVGVRGSVNQIYNGIDTDLYRPPHEPGRIRRQLGISNGAFVVTICGRLDPIKDHLTLFRAFDLFAGDGADVRLLVVGDGPERERLEREATGETLFLGHREDVPDILADTDVFVLCSLNEGISNTILEAMATGLPVVATRVGGNPELVEDGVTGTLVPPGDHEAIAASLLEYRRRPGARARHGAAGRQRATLRFSVGAMVAAYEALYRRVAPALQRGKRV